MLYKYFIILGSLLALFSIALEADDDPHKYHMLKKDEPVILAPGWHPLKFAPPAPGTYELRKIFMAEDGQIVDQNGQFSTLHELYDNRIVLLSFIYTTCPDINGCPLATAVMHKLNDKFANHADLAKHVRLISLSFDPKTDSPAVMTEYGKQFSEGHVDWDFLTTSSEKALDPILNKYFQTVIRVKNEDGESEAAISHILRVYLIDKNKTIRNIYSVSFLHADLLINDIKTLLME